MSKIPDSYNFHRARLQSRISVTLQNEDDYQVVENLRCDLVKTLNRLSKEHSDIRKKHAGLTGSALTLMLSVFDLETKRIEDLVQMCERRLNQLKGSQVNTGFLH